MKFIYGYFKISVQVLWIVYCDFCKVKCVCVCIFSSTASHACTKCLYTLEKHVLDDLLFSFVFYREHFLHICLTCIKHTHIDIPKHKDLRVFVDAKHPVFPRYPTNPQKEKHPHSVLCRIAEVIPLRCVRFILCLGGFGGVFHPWKSRDPDQAIRGWFGLDDLSKGFAILPIFASRLVDLDLLGSTVVFERDLWFTLGSHLPPSRMQSWQMKVLFRIPF